MIRPPGRQVTNSPWFKKDGAHFLEPIQEEVESHESVVILYWRLIREGAPDVESRTPSCSRAARPTISQRSNEPRMGIGGADDSTGQTWRPTAGRECAW